VRRRTAALALCVVASLAFGCATESQLEEKVIGASPAPDSGFLDTPERMAPHRARDPFDRSWVSEKLDWASYDALYVAPVDTTHVLAQSLWEKVNLREHAVQGDIRELGSRRRGDRADRGSDPGAIPNAR
jgi:hypothetical protein